MRSNPSACACAFTCCEPGTTITRTFGLTLRPFNNPAAARKSVRNRLRDCATIKRFDGILLREDAQ